MSANWSVRGYAQFRALLMGALCLMEGLPEPNPNSLPSKQDRRIKVHKILHTLHSLGVTSPQKNGKVPPFSPSGAEITHFSSRPSERLRPPACSDIYARGIKGAVAEKSEVDPT